MTNFYTSTSVLFMLLFLSNLVLFSQGRNLVTKENSNLNVYEVKVTLGIKVEEKEASPNQLGRRGFRFMEGSVDAFQPSTPGHSPGIGHSKHD
ncbi:hypothetical protein RND71_032847 [Anisodus tanguticus]|uniref:Transmembrane protein n=1 Tax=Anisodus tanguticus TaxID=243964 RepID=A0AAE1UVM6_9SOLA|nr:hypothetical protein RND71_032847 [Anisodus tanguticus]